MRKIRSSLTPTQRRRLALAGFVGGGVLAVLVNQDATGLGEPAGEDAVDQQAVQTENPVELGSINWVRNYNEGIAAAGESGRPMLLLFQEVPG